MTPWQKHVQRWSGCTDCALCHQRDKIVLGRGQVPADVCFAGEAPGESENLLGRPFVGPAGKLLDQIIERSCGTTTYALTNLVCCFPKLAKHAGDNEPAPAEIKACAIRLQEFIEICLPRLIVAVGKLAETWLPRVLTEHQALTIKRVAITHPAAILRMPIAQQGMTIQRAIVIIENAVEELQSVVQ